MDEKSCRGGDPSDDGPARHSTMERVVALSYQLALPTQWHQEGGGEKSITRHWPACCPPPLLVVARSATAVQLGIREVTWLRFLLRTPAW